MKKTLHYSIWILIFSYLFIYGSQIPDAIYKVGIPALTYLLFLIALLEHRSLGRFMMPFHKWFIAYLGVSIASSLINSRSPLSLLYFLNYTTIGYLYFVTIYNETSVILIKKVKRLVVYLILLQIPVVLYKLILYGASESGLIGTIGIYAGSLSAIFPLLIISFLVSFYLYTRDSYYLIFIFFFVLFGYIGMKRILVFLVPLIIFAGAFLFSFWEVTLSKKTIKNIVVAIILSPLLFYLLVIGSPSLNPERKVGGSFNLQYLSSYVIDYTSSEGRSLREMRRLAGLRYFVNTVYKGGLSRFLFGDGPGSVLQSSFVRDVGGDMWKAYGVRYGGRMGFVWLLLQVGFTGAFLYMFIIVLLTKRVFFYMQGNIVASPFYLGFLLASVVIVFDIFLYSNVSVKNWSVNMIYFFVGSLIVKQKEELLSSIF